MGIFDYFGIIGAIIEPTSSYNEMKDNIESNKEETINDSASVELEQDSNILLTDLINNNDVGSVEPVDDFNSLMTDIMIDFDNNHDRKDEDVFITDDNDG